MDNYLKTIGLIAGVVCLSWTPVDAKPDSSDGLHSDALAQIDVCGRNGFRNRTTRAGHVAKSEMLLDGRFLQLAERRPD